MSRPARKLLQPSIDDELGQALIALARAEAASEGTRERILESLGVEAEPEEVQEPRRSDRRLALSSERMAEWCIRGRTRRV